MCPYLIVRSPLPKKGNVMRIKRVFCLFSRRNDNTKYTESIFKATPVFEIRTYCYVSFFLEKYSKVLVCNGVSKDYPVNEQLYRCDASIDDFNIRFDSGDT